ncbi:MAG: class I SAM-dependent methyltransferase [Bacteroidetes bacterium]|nr:class I SAM-dependent methyltransferase [Bacteroidota bacterium]
MQLIPGTEKYPASYRDRDGFIFKYNNQFYRCINKTYFSQYQHLMDSGLYDLLVKKKWLIAHEEVKDKPEWNSEEYRVIYPQQIAYVSYPYEWSFEMWKDAALLTLDIALTAMEKGMLLKDATPFNIQFVQGKPVFIDTLSFELYDAAKPWIAYRQFCECFIAPLLLQKYADASMNHFFQLYPNGIPLQLVQELLPAKAKWNVHNYMHVYLQGKIKTSKRNASTAQQPFSKPKMLLLLNGLHGYVKKMQVKPAKTIWDDYYTDTILSKQYLDEKAKLVQSLLKKIPFQTVIDLGANDGYFSLLLKDKASAIVSADSDVNCINQLYLKIKNEKISNILPVVSALHTPSPSIGWHHTERMNFTERFKGDVVLALALVHHLAIANNVPLEMIAQWFAALGNYLLVEFVPKTDDKVKQLLQYRQDIFDDYHSTGFEKAFGNYFDILTKATVPGTERILYLAKKR